MSHELSLSERDAVTRDFIPLVAVVTVIGGGVTMVGASARVVIHQTGNGDIVEMAANVVKKHDRCASGPFAHASGE